MKFRRYLVLGFAILTMVSSYNYVKSSIEGVYYFTLQPVSETIGTIIQKEKSESIEGGISYEYLVEYQINGKKYELRELLSPDSAIEVGNNSTFVRYSLKNPKLSTMKNYNEMFRDILTVGLMMILVIAMLSKVFLSYKNKVDIVFDD